MIRKISMLAATLALTVSIDTLCGEISLESFVQLEAQKGFVTSNVHGNCARASVTITGIDADRYVETASAFLDSQDAFSAVRNGYSPRQ